MTDTELIQLLQDKTPEELSLDQIRLLQQRLAESDELRTALFEQLEMEQYLAEALGRIEVSTDKIIARSRANATVSGNPLLLAVAAVLSLGLIGFIATVMVIALRKPEAEEVAVVDEQPVVEEESSEEPIPEPVEEEPPTETAPEEEPPPQTETPEPEPEREPPAEPEPPQGPWAASLAEAPRPFDKTWFVDFDVAKRVPSQEDMTQWFAAVPGKPFRAHEEHFENVRYGAIQGAARLKAPWPADALLRFSLLKSDALRIHLFAGEQGVTLFRDSRHDNLDRWAAYVTTRDAQQPVPKTFVLTSTDEGRDEFSEARYGPSLLLRWDAGEIVLTRGDIEMVRAAMPQPPEEIYWEGQAAFRGIELLRYTDPPAKQADGEVVAAIAKPAELNWQSGLAEPAKLEMLDDGAVRLAMNKRDQGAWAAAALPVSQVGFVELLLADIQPGTIVYLGPPEVRDGEGKVVQPAGRPGEYALTFVANQNGGQLAAVWDRRDENRRTQGLPNIDDRSVPYVRSQTWVRFLTAVDRVCCWISPDGENWARLSTFTPNYGPLTHLGIGCSRGSPDAKIVVQQIRLRALPAINRLAAGNLLEQAPALGQAYDYSQWLVQATRAQPGDVATSDWLAACALRTIAGGCNGRVGQALLDSLLQNGAEKSAEEQLALLDDVALLASAGEKLPGDRQFNLPERYFEVGRRLAEAGEPRPFTKIRPALMDHFAAQRNYYKAYDPGLIRTELIELAYAGNWAELAEFVRQLKFYAGRDALPQSVPLATWAEAIAARHLPGSVGDGAAMLDAQWQNPLIEEYSKEAYNVMAEFQAALDSESYEDAASMIAALDPYDTDGLVPSAHEANLLVSLKTAIASATANSRDLAEVMNQKFAPLGRLRVNQAMTAGDQAAVELATIQFHGTKAAGDAHGWLGDRALSSGEFAQAMAHYRQAVEQASVLEKPQLLARMRLTAAMAGHDYGEPAKIAVRLGDTSLAANEFEALVQEMRAAHAADVGLLTTAGAAGEALDRSPQPSGFQVQTRARFDGDAGENPGNISGHVRQHDVPWLERQLGITVQENIAYVTNRFHVAAYDLNNNGNRLWQSPRPPGNPGQTHDWMFTLMRPVPYGDRVYVRQLLREGPMLVALNRQNGQHVWTSQRRDVQVLSDPVFAQGKLFVLTLHDGRESEDRLRLSALALDTGEMLESYDLIGLRDSWRVRRACAVTQWEDSLIASLGGLVICVDLTGQMRWARKQVMLPGPSDPSWVAQRFDRPLVVDRRVVVAAPGVRTVECLDIESGALVWQRILPYVNRLISASPERVIVHAGEELCALDFATGKTVWEQKWLAPYDAELTTGENGLLLVHKVRSPSGGNQFCPELVWFDPATGQQQAQTQLAELVADDPRFGPLVTHQNRVWSFFARSINDQHRDLIELVPQGEASPARVVTSNQSAWLTNVANLEIRDAVARAVEPWQLLATVAESSVFLPDTHGEKEMARLTSKADAATVLGRQIEIPRVGNPKLVMRIGSEPNHHWKLIVRHGQQVLLEQDMDWAKNPNVWKEISVDLSPAAGKNGWLTVEAQFVGGGDRTWTYWKRLDVAL
jgi:outer membrane protein assembly factor BamB